MTKSASRIALAIISKAANPPAELSSATRVTRSSSRTDCNGDKSSLLPVETKQDRILDRDDDLVTNFLDEGLWCSCLTADRPELDIQGIATLCCSASLTRHVFMSRRDARVLTG